MKVRLTKFKKSFWRNLYRFVIFLEIKLHLLDLWLYKKVDYTYFVKNNKEEQIVGVSRHPFRERR